MTLPPSASPPDLIDPADAIPALELVLAAARTYLEELPSLPAKEAGAAARAAFSERLPERGIGTLAAVERLGQYVRGGAVHVDGPRFFHLVAGGSTPAALAGDWLCSLFDQHAFASMSSPAAVRLEQAMIDWLKDLFALPQQFGGHMVTGGTMANFTALAAARQWSARAGGFDAAEEGTAAAPPIEILTTGRVHSSIHKAAAMLGIGRRRVRAVGQVGECDLSALEHALAQPWQCAPIVVANAGEVNAGTFDPIDAMADLAERHGAWLHVDGTFGLFARVSPRLAHLAAGVERAHSVTADGHKWLNVPFDAGFCFVRDGSLLGEVFSMDGSYLRGDPDAAGMLGLRGPEMSRRARAFSVYATLAAYGREGYRTLVERSVELARALAQEVTEARDFELLIQPSLCITSFRFRPPGLDEPALDNLNARLGEAILDDGRVYLGTTVTRGHVAFKPAFVNWRTTAEDVALILPIIRELATTLEPA